MRTAPAPLFNDPIYNGAADPTIIWNHLEKQWWIIYTQRRHNGLGMGVADVHGSDLGVASSPDGHNWLYRGTLEGLAIEPGHNTWWAPEVMFHEGIYHMYASYVQGIPTSWDRPRKIIHYTSQDLWHWKFESILDLQSDRVIDACVVKTPQGIWRMWYKDECDNSYVHYADSTDLYHWEHKGCAVDMDSHEGPNVFFLEGKWWYVADFWRGQGVFSGEDCLHWDFQGYILRDGSSRPDDYSKGNHGDILIHKGEAYIFYFAHTHPTPGENGRPGRPGGTSLQVAHLRVEDGKLLCDRDEVFPFELTEPESEASYQ